MIWTLVAAILFGWWFYGGSSDEVRANLISNLDKLQTYSDGSYQNYVNQYAQAAKPAEAVRIKGDSYSAKDGCECNVLPGYEGASGNVLSTGDSGSVTWKFDVKTEGLYQIKLRYFTAEGKSAAIERGVAIDGKLPFDEAASITFDRAWRNETEDFKEDNRGNNIRPRQVEVATWLEEPFKDSQGLYADPFQFYFAAGEHSLTLTGLREPLVIDYIELYPKPELPTYAEVKQQYEANGYKAAQGVSVKIQAEHATYKSSPTLYPVSDHSSPATEPYSASKIRLNTIGGLNWRLPGQWIEWELDVPQDGLYQLGLKARQDLLRGLYSNRTLSIDGVVPFKEMESIPFNYDSGWQMVVPSLEKEPYRFYLTKGKHSIRLEADLGEVSSLIRTVQSSMLELNRIYRKILVITSADPDPFRDYQLGKRIPEISEVYAKQSDILYSVAEELRGITGEKSDKTAILYLLAKELRRFAEDPETIPKNLKQFKIDLGSLGTWLLTVREMPLQVDYLVLSSPDMKMPSATKGTMANLAHNVSSFGYSFVEDYNSIGSTATGGKKVTVWIGTGRDQANVIKQMIDDSFTPANNAGVDLKLVDMSVLLSATLAGQGPDVAMMIGNGDPVNYAMRGASYDISQFPDYAEVARRFADSASTPYKFNGGVYALPEQQVYDVLFYRKDILEELGLQIPQTWDDVYKLLPFLKKNNMDFGLPIISTRVQQPPALPINDAFATLLYQHGGSFYKEDGSASDLDSEIGMSAFKQWTDLYTDYKFPVDYDFANRFRLGEVPLGIDAYTTYNTLSVFAPEIRGQWGFTLVPGTKKEDGTVDRTVSSNGTAVMMLDSAKDKLSAWEFMKWWTDETTQVQYGREMESLMGESARYPTANVKALAELPWPVNDYKTLAEQQKWVKGIPEVPGGYFTGRILDNAFRRVVNKGLNPRDALYDQVVFMNNEITNKRKEFGLNSSGSEGTAGGKSGN
ncbi:extracellular solute-binding protein [Cohnella suwonensis]|uniref:Extracellular solute-binding protein n=1 Tax=Cohnella suwonensis TaxID=696072 RepID=A0ABW0LT74_9BACL